MAGEPELRDLPVTVVGLGIEGIDLVRYLSSQGARVTVSDSRSAEELREPLDAIADCDATLSLDSNRTEDLISAETVYVSQGVPANLPALEAARAAGVPISSMTRFFFERCPAPIAGITGSSGKTTTTALVGAMLDAAKLDHVTGGNIGIGLLGLLDGIKTETRVVVELSHTQLETLDVSPELACVTNVTPNHLDHYSWEQYVALKRRVFQFQRDDDLTIINLDDEVCAGFALEAPARVAATSMTALPADGAALEGDAIVRRDRGRSTVVMPRADVALRGDHNVANVLSAVAVATRLGVPHEAIAEGVRGFHGVPHRLETVAMAGGVEYVNDSIATTPERSLAGLRSFDGPVVLLLGGRDKHLPIEGLATEAVSHCRTVVTFGEASELFASAIDKARAGETPPIEQVDDVSAAVEAAARLARSGDVVLFAPGGTSFDAYRSFEQRGEDFRSAVAGLGDA
ncbi:MAG TPA: UDP-N-acetylmuramoyl-L-alanine--D-glutamate ligase [Dehalococcoidia bacterium]|nr:UDP-N-acetylmuramoyl-L-alanine--D-glutamate ligase [Dehalococcoidia bacterium]